MRISGVEREGPLIMVTVGRVLRIARTKLGESGERHTAYALKSWWSTCMCTLGSVKFHGHSISTKFALIPSE